MRNKYLLRLIALAVMLVGIAFIVLGYNEYRWYGILGLSLGLIFMRNIE